jgi:hypothetical protein
MAVYGAFGSEEVWRSIRNGYMKSNDSWCMTCFPTDLGEVLWSSFALSWSLSVNHFTWLWTIPQEFFGAGMVYCLAPVSRFVVNYGIRADGTDDYMRVGGQIWPRKLLRCITFHGLLLAVIFVLGQAVSHCADTSGLITPSTWCVSLVLGGSSIGVLGSLWRVIFLFELGLASAQLRVLLCTPLHGRHTWSAALLAKSGEQWSLKWLLPMSLIAFGMFMCTVPLRNVVSFGPALTIKDTGFDMYLLAASSVFLGVVLGPPEVREFLSSLSHLGDVSFSMYLLHMGVIWSIGQPVYVWLNSMVHPAALFPAVMAICAGPLYLLSYLFWVIIDEPLGIRIPRQTFSWLKWLIQESRKPQKAPISHAALHDAMEKAALTSENGAP